MKDDRKSGNKYDDMEFLDLDEQEETDLEENTEDDWEDEPEPLQPWKIIFIFAGLTVLAAIISAGLWMITHRDQSTPPDHTITPPPVVAADSPEGPTVEPGE